MHKYMQYALVCALSLSVACTGSPLQSTTPPANGNIIQTSQNSGLVLIDPVSNLIHTYSFFTVQDAVTLWPYIASSPVMNYTVLNTNSPGNMFVQIPPVLVVPLTPLEANTTYTFQMNAWFNSTNTLMYNTEQVAIPPELPYSSFTSSAWCFNTTVPSANSPFYTPINAVEVIDYHPASNWILALSSISCSTVYGTLVYSGFLFSNTTVSLQTVPSDITFSYSAGNVVTLSTDFVLPGILRFVRSVQDTISGEVLNFMAITGYSPGLSSFFQGVNFEGYLASFSGTAFSPASLPVTVQTLTPADGSSGVPITAVIQATFSNTTLGFTNHAATVILEDVDTQSVFPPALLTTATVLDAGDDITAVTVTPAVPLSHSTEYRAFVLFDWTPVAAITFTTQ